MDVFTGRKIREDLVMLCWPICGPVSSHYKDKTFLMKPKIIH